MAKKASGTSAPTSSKKSTASTLGVKSIQIPPPRAGAEFHYVSVSAPATTTTATTAVTVTCRCTATSAPTFSFTVTEQPPSEVGSSLGLSSPGFACGNSINVDTPKVGFFYVVAVTMKCGGVDFTD